LWSDDAVPAIDFDDLRYGKVNAALARRWMALPDGEDGPFLALNLMRYRPRAQYADGRATSLTGREADDAYTPLGPLAAVGARLLLAAEVTEQRGGGPRFHRVAIVRYPTRASFFEMQQREDFQELHVHKDAGMEFTIILAAEPPAAVAQPSLDAPLVVRVRRFARCAARPEDPDGVAAVARLELDDVVIGDERRWDDVRVDRVAAGALGRLEQATGVDEQIVLVLADPMLDALANGPREPDGAR
jgi:hypothetical protein